MTNVINKKNQYLDDLSNAPHDTLFTTPLDKSARFSFDESVVACFPDMIRRSVPGYGQMLAMLPIIARRHCLFRQVNEAGNRVSRIYDLGCSLGAVSLALADKFTPDELEIHAIDISEPMIARAKSVVAEHYPKHDIRLKLADICQLQMQPCDMIIINLTLQFLAPDVRLSVLKKCHEALTDGGVLILTEKTHLTDEQDDAWRVERYYDFKRANGYSELEISAKRNALENVLMTDTLEQHAERLAEAGFSRSMPWFMFLNFASLIAFK